MSTLNRGADRPRIIRFNDGYAVSPASRLRLFATGEYDRTGDGSELMTEIFIPAFPLSNPPEYVDACAWFPSDETRWWSRFREAVFLGENNLNYLPLIPGDIVLHSTPMGWLRGGRRGLCVLDWKRRSEIVARLGHRNDVIADSKEMADHLNTILSRRVDALAPVGVRRHAV